MPAQAGIRQFAEKRNVWIQWLCEDEEHSIQKQIDDIVFDHAVYKCLRIASSKQPEGSISPLPPIVRWYLDKSYVANQFMGIRRVCDTNRKKDSITIKGLLEDIKQNIHLFTRENFVCYDGVPFDPRPEREKHEQEIRKRCNAGEKCIVNPIKPFMVAENRHLAFDKLLCVIDKNCQITRKPSESLSKKLIDKISSHLGCCAKIQTIASKYHAHASDQNNRNSIPENERTITFNYIEKCHLTLCGVASFIGSNLFDSPLCVAYPQFQVFKGFGDTLKNQTEKMENDLRDHLEKYRNVKLFN